MLTRKEAFKINFNWQQQYMMQVESLLKRNAGAFLRISIASAEQDMKQSTDMVLEVGGAGTVAVRIRRPNCRFRDLTLRSFVPSGAKTELEKIRDDGFGDWYLYAWADIHDVLREWMLIDLNILRDSGLLYAARPETRNFDGTRFTSYSIPELRITGAIVAGHVNGISLVQPKEYRQ